MGTASYQIRNLYCDNIRRRCLVFRQMDNKRILGRLIDQWRCATLEEARAGHKLAVAAVEKGEIGE